jgi:hypothetical protein
MKFTPDHIGLWDSTDLNVPLEDFVEMFKLTEAELGRECGSARIAMLGVPIQPKSGDTWGFGFEDCCFRESAIKEWLRSKLPRRIARKVAEAGGLSVLERWRIDYFKNCDIDIEGEAIVLPNGERITGLRFKRGADA